MPTLLPVFEQFKLTQDLSAEEPETFAWLHDDERADFEKARAGLDSIPGSREYLKNYAFQKEEGMPFFNGVGNEILVSFGDHHSGHSSTQLAWIYKRLLNDWAEFVYGKKQYYARKLYDAQQLSDEDLIPFVNGTVSCSAAITSIIKKFNLPFQPNKVYEMLSALAKEREDESEAKRIKYDTDYYKSRIGILKHHYQYPIRWNDTENGSTLFGSINNVTERMVNDMVQIYPNYREHIASIKARTAEKI